MVVAVTRVAVLGTGRMGGAMAGRLASHGFAVTVHNRTPQRAVQVANTIGAAVAATPREAVAEASTVVVSLADDAAVREVYHGPDGLGAGVSPGTVVLETSTIAPSTVRSLSPLVAEGGAVLLDAPVSGSVPVVERGELTFLIGGPVDAVERARPVLDVLGTKVFTLGPLGAGATMKLAVNAVVHGLNQALAEALVLAERAGVDRAQAYEVFAASAVAAPFVHYKRNSFVDPAATPVAFMLDLVAKDLALIDDLAAEVGARMDQVSTNRRIVEEALTKGLGSSDLSALASMLRGET
jgi:3-hydroxyisobutyrate dehydrogenase-like beta-hydroxyacid dehydrogenase